MFKSAARKFVVAGLVLAAGLFAAQAAQAQGFSISFGNGSGYYGGGFPGYGNGFGYNPYVGGYRGPAFNPYVTGYRGPVVNPYTSSYFPYNSYRTNVSPYINHYGGHSHCW
jgi:hypothetical protein